MSPFCDTKVSLAAAGSAINQVLINNKRLIPIRITERKGVIQGRKYLVEKTALMMECSLFVQEKN